MAFYDRVLETTTTTGTGDITPAGAVAGFAAFDDTLTIGDVFDYAIFAVDANGIPTGAWECGVGEWTGTVIERTTVQASSNGGVAVNFGAGTKHIMLSVNAASLAGMGAGAFRGVIIQSGTVAVGPGMVVVDLEGGTPTILADTDGALNGDGTITIPAGVEMVLAHLTIAAASGGDTITAFNAWVSADAFPGVGFSSVPLANSSPANVYTRTFAGVVEAADVVRVLIQATGVTTSGNVDAELTLQFL